EISNIRSIRACIRRKSFAPGGISCPTRFRSETLQNTKNARERWWMRSDVTISGAKKALGLIQWQFPLDILYFSVGQNRWGGPFGAWRPQMYKIGIGAAIMGILAVATAAGAAENFVPLGLGYSPDRQQL